MVREIRVPSSSNSSSGMNISVCGNGIGATPPTDGHGLDLDAILDVGAIGVVGVLVGDDGLAAESVDKGGSTWRIGQLA